MYLYIHLTRCIDWRTLDVAPGSDVLSDTERLLVMSAEAKGKLCCLMPLAGQCTVVHACNPSFWEAEAAI